MEESSIDGRAGREVLPEPIPVLERTADLPPEMTGMPVAIRDRDALTFARHACIGQAIVLALPFGIDLGYE